MTSIFFTCAMPLAFWKIDIRDGAESEFDNDDANGDEDDPPVLAVPFSTTVKKGAEVLKFGCTATDAVDINSVEFYNDKDEEDTLYDGPTFDELDEELQDAFHEYLAGLGVGSDLAEFISMYAEYIEQQEYVSWLGKVESFVRDKW